MVDAFKVHLNVENNVEECDYGLGGQFLMGTTKKLSNCEWRRYTLAQPVWKFEPVQSFDKTSDWIPYTCNYY